MRVIQTEENDCLAELGGISTRVRTDLISDLKTGDYVIVHAGFAIQKLDEEDALETLRVLDEMAGLAVEEEHPGLS